MTPEQFARVQALFQSGFARPPGERAAFLAEACADDPEVRSKVERMLARAERERGETEGGRGFLEPPGFARGVPVGAPEELDRQLAQEFARGGRYLLQVRIGEGGFGSVWRAEQLEPVRRTVALKVIKPGMDTRSVLARFEAERQTLARMSHPGIATVFDAGVTERGRPFFVMELADGVPLTTHCDRERLDLAARLELFLRVCAAVQHAHQKGIVHRDLKPSNVLVGTLDGTAAPKVIDFGIAKAMDTEAAGETLTAERAFMGTPEYASPEQAAGARDLDTRTDVYSLGAMLYELVLGLTPLDRSRAQDPGLLGVLALIQRVDPTPPSTRLGTLGAQATEIAHLRRTDTASLRRRLRGDLDWITMKALERDPARRYATVDALADDVRRFLRDEPVLARAPSAGYRFGKFARRNRGLLAAVAIVALVLIGGIVGTSLGLYRALEARKGESAALREVSRANVELERTNADLAAAMEEAEAGRREAEEKRDEVLKLSALQDLDDLVAEAAGLWPASPLNVPRFERWIAAARELVAELPLHEARRTSLRGKALPWSDAQRDAERASQPGLARLAELATELERTAQAAAQAEDEDSARVAEERLGALEAEQAALEAELDQRHDWRFPESEPQARWWNNQLTKLIDGLRELERGLLAEDRAVPGHGWSIPQRLAFARAVQQRSLGDAEVAARWREACASLANVAECPAYAGLVLAPQLGLLPIGRDPDSGLWEFAHLASGAPAARGSDGRLVMKEETGIVLVLIPGGRFRMGAQAGRPDQPNHDPAALPEEGPVHEVELSPFFLGKYELTLAQWMRATGVNPNQIGPHFYDTLWNRERLPATFLQPVEQVSWYACFETLSRHGLTLPTEAQWEYAARAGTSTVYWTGDAVASLQGAANLSDAYGKANGNQGWPNWEPGIDDGNSSHAEIGSYRANPFGLHDVLGNVLEWCLDGWSDSFYRSSPERDPLCPPETSSMRICRGGSFSFVSGYLRSASRLWGPPDAAPNFQGCRPARAVTPAGAGD